MPLGLCILTFLGLEGFLLYFSGNLTINLSLGLFSSAIIYLLATLYESQKNAKQDHPANIFYELPAPEVFSIVLSSLKTFRMGERRWNISEVDRNNYSIIAFSEWHDRSWREYKYLVPDELTFRQIKLQLAIRQQKLRQTELRIIWSVVSPLTRAECNALQDCTSGSIHNALRNAEVNRTKKFTTSN